MSNAKTVWRERCWKRREVGGLEFHLMTNNESVFVSAEGHQKVCTLLSLTSTRVWYSTRNGFFFATQIFFSFFFFSFHFFVSSWYWKGRWISSKFHIAQEYLLSAAWPRTERTYSCKQFNCPIHKILDQSLKICVVEKYLLSSLSQLKWSWTSYQRSCLSVLSFLVLLSRWRGSRALLEGPFLTLSDMQSWCILVLFSKYASCF